MLKNRHLERQVKWSVGVKRGIAFEIINVGLKCLHDPLQCLQQVEIDVPVLLSRLKNRPAPIPFPFRSNRSKDLAFTLTFHNRILTAAVLRKQRLISSSHVLSPTSIYEGKS